MNTFLKQLGIVLIVLATVLLITSYAVGLTDYNGLNGGALALMIAGLIVHIIMNKRIQD